MTQEFLDFVDKMTPDLPEEETSQETTSLTEEERTELNKAFCKDFNKNQKRRKEENRNPQPVTSGIL